MSRRRAILHRPDSVDRLPVISQPPQGWTPATHRPRHQVVYLPVSAEAHLRGGTSRRCQALVVRVGPTLRIGWDRRSPYRHPDR